MSSVKVTREIEFGEREFRALIRLGDSSTIFLRKAMDMGGIPLEISELDPFISFLEEIKEMIESEKTGKACCSKEFE